MIERLFFGQGSRVSAEGASFTVRQWALLVLGAVACLAACDGVAVMAGLPAEPGFDGSLLAGPAPVGAILTVAVAVAVSLAVGTVVAGSVGVEAATFCGSLGLAAVAARCGPIRPVLEYAAGRGVFVALAAESALLGGLTWAGWWAVDRLARAARSAAAAEEPIRFGIASEVNDATPAQRASALGVTVLVTAAVEMVLVQTDAGKQAAAGVAVASFLGVLAGYQYLPVGVGAWYWTAPPIVGVIGYLLAAVAGAGLAVGEVHGWFAALARPTPLDSAGLGTATAMLGHWFCRRWAQADEPPQLPDADAPPA